MPVLSEAELRALRGVQADNFPHRCDLEYPVTVERDTGGRTTSWATAFADVPCRLVPLSGAEVPRGLVLSPETNYKLTLPYGQLVAPTMRAVVTGETDGVAWVKTIGITFVDDPKAFTTATPAYGTDAAAQGAA